MVKKTNADLTPWAYAAPTGGITNTATAVTVKTAGSASVKNYITGLQLSHATLGGATEFCIRDGAGGTVLYRMTLGTAANENVTQLFDPPLVGSLATLLEIITLTAVTGAVVCNIQGYSAT